MSEKRWTHPYWATKRGKEDRTSLKMFGSLTIVVGILFLVSLLLDKVDVLPMAGAALLGLILLLFIFHDVRINKLRFEFEAWKSRGGVK